MLFILAEIDPIIGKNRDTPRPTLQIGEWHPTGSMRWAYFLGARVGLRMQSAMRATLTISATSWTRTMWAPCKMLAVTVAAVPQIFDSAATPAGCGDGVGLAS